MTATILHTYQHFWHGPRDHADGVECTACRLAFCKTCLGAEGELPTDCPGRALTEIEAQAIYDGKLDFIRGHWISVTTQGQKQ